MIVVQYIRVVWTKASRGAPGSVARNAVPELFPLPASVASSSGELLVQQVTAREAAGFVPQVGELRRDELAPLQLGTLELIPEATSARVVLRSSPPLVVELGSWGRMRANRRHVDRDTGQWYYTKDVVNVAVCERPSPDLFAGDPAQVVDAETHLQ